MQDRADTEAARLPVARDEQLSRPWADHIAAFIADKEHTGVAAATAKRWQTRLEACLAFTG